MIFKKIWSQLNFIKQCHQYSLTIWQCPNFLFLILGIVIIVAILITYYLASLYTPEPQIAALIVLVVTGILIIIGHLIVQSFSHLADANQEKSEFISIASHQLRTPLTNIKWALSLMIGGRLSHVSNEQLENLRTIKENNQRMIHLVNDLLVASRIDQGRLTMNLEKVNLGRIAQKLVKDYQAYAQANNVTLRLAIANDLPDLLIDPQQIELASRHLLDNGIRYIKDTGWVEIRLKSNKKYLRCEVEDNGVGIPENDQSKIFQKFFRSQNVMRYQTQGTGLGLFITKAIIKNFKGKIGFWSKEEKGSTFWFELPIKS